MMRTVEFAPQALPPSRIKAQTGHSPPPAASSAGPMSLLNAGSSQPSTPRASRVFGEPQEVDDIHTADAVSVAPTTRTVTDDRSVHSRQPLVPKETSFWEKYNPSLRLQNSGSVARDHLASERTFLAYVRTSLTIASMGVALVQLFTIAASTQKNLQIYSRPLGGTIIILGLVTLSIGVFRYFMVQKALLGGNFPATRISAGFLSATLMAIIIALFAILLSVRNT